MDTIQHDDRDQQNDDSVRDAVMGALIQEERISVTGLRVGVQNGIVHLSGGLPSLETWETVEKIAAQVPGVRGVVNRIEAPGAPSAGREIDLDLNSETKGELK